MTNITQFLTAVRVVETMTGLATSGVFKPFDPSRPSQCGVFYDETRPVNRDEIRYYPVYWPRGSRDTQPATCKQATGIPVWLTTEQPRPAIIISLTKDSHVKITEQGWDIIGQEHLTGITANLREYLNQRLHVSD